eukprot:m.117475 g.117475  ORF g.117475 m.117475 type:complete len:114 (+) comp37614_c0_seq7:1517-1858(+)
MMKEKMNILLWWTVCKMPLICQKVIASLPPYRRKSLLFLQVMEKMKTDAIKLLGEEQFQKVYEFLQLARCGDAGAGKPPISDERLVQKELNRICKEPRNCFLVDQLIFMEMIK